MCLSHCCGPVAKFIPASKPSPGTRRPVSLAAGPRKIQKCGFSADPRCWGRGWPRAAWCIASLAVSPTRPLGFPASKSTAAAESFVGASMARWAHTWAQTKLRKGLEYSTQCQKQQIRAVFVSHLSAQSGFNIPAQGRLEVKLRDLLGAVTGLTAQPRGLQSQDF